MKARSPVRPANRVMAVAVSSARVPVRATPSTWAAGGAGTSSLLHPSRIPLLFFQVYLTASVLVFAFGPLELQIRNPWTLYPYVLVGQLAILIGYNMGVARPPREYNHLISIDTVLKITIVTTLVLIPATISSRNYGSLSLAEALADPGAAYTARSEMFERGDATERWLSISRGLMGPILAMFLPLGIVCWNRLSSAWKLAWLAGLAGMIWQSVLSGAAIGLFDIVIMTPWMLWLNLHHRQQFNGVAGSATTSGVRRLSVSQSNLRPAGSNLWPRKVCAGLVAIGVLAGGIHYFNYSRQSRFGMSGDEYPPFTVGWSQTMYGVALPESVEYPIYMLANYWTQGYQGLSESLELPFVWCWGVGHSTFWMRNAGQLMDNPEVFWKNCYPARLETESGYSATNNWHTIYPWLASDLTFPGAIVFMGALSFLFSRVWQDSLRGRNPFAVGLTAQMLILFFYIPANNGRLSYPEESMSFWGLVFIWLCTRSITSIPLRGK